jgi:enterochelin esterase-like enzyme
MVLANGQYMFTSSADGAFNLDVPLDGDGRITLYAFCSGRSPYKNLLETPTTGLAIDLPTDSDGSPPVVSIDTLADSETKPGWVDISGTIENGSGTPLCAMILANGQYTFTCEPMGAFELTAPPDSRDEILLYGFCSGFTPHKETIHYEPGGNPAPVKTAITMDSASVGTTYNIVVGLPHGYRPTGPSYPAIFLLDGDGFFPPFYAGLDPDDRFILIGINNTHRRNIDYLPANNTCEAERGGSDAFLAFLVTELVPYLDARYHIDPALRLLLGHSHGGSFVFYTLFVDHGQTFPLLFANDASLQCWTVPLNQQYHFSLDQNPLVIFYASGATERHADVVRPVMEALIQANHTRLIIKYDEIQGTHDGILNTAIDNGLDWIGSQVEAAAE